jgi:hypothetical protein
MWPSIEPADARDIRYSEDSIENCFAER